MLALIDSTKYLHNYQNKKCAEVFWQNETFSIVCNCCEMKTFDFDDFLLHFRNLHLQNDLPDELEKAQQNFEVNDLKYKLKYDNSTIHSDNINTDDFNLSKYDSRTDEDDSEFENYSSSYNDEDHIPKIMTASAKQTQCSQLTCDYCNKTYKLKTTLKKHIKNCHDDSNLYKCSQCNEKFQQERALNKHLRTKHTGFPCDKCDKVYKSRAGLHVHKYNHSDVRKFACDVENCSKSYFSPKLLQAHKRIVHRADYYFVCETCGYRTKKKNYLVVHVRSHTGEKPFICTECNKGFASQALLTEHKPIHSSERPHKCQECGATFVTSKSLYHHKHLHLGIKKYVCKVCGKAYAQAAGLSGHMRQHKIDPFK
ncbi:zinc finger protein 664-like [Teleopsis dalmanni]|uniref:zinc finger protein 664-like n=1 Tax=Teleopsis dalmanni TaxID=139649 RepID=UPI0018CECDB2|nr:zinc finger protein 664-like [Teleopsis dalmanni]